MIEPILESNQVQLTKNVRLQIDKLNKTLLFKRVRKEGKGRGASDSNEYTYGNEKYFGTYEMMVQKLLEKEFMDYVGSSIVNNEKRDLENLSKIIEDCKDHIEKCKNEIVENLKSKIVIDLGKDKSE